MWHELQLQNSHETMELRAAYEEIGYDDLRGPRR